MVILYFHTPLFHEVAHLRPEVKVDVVGQRTVITCLVTNLITVIFVALNAAVPFRLYRVDSITDVIRRGVVTYVVENMEFKFRSDKHVVRDVLFTEIVDCRQRYVAGVLVKTGVFFLADNANVTHHSKGRRLDERFDKSGVHIGNKYHIALFYRSVTVVTAVKTDTVFKSVFRKSFNGYGEVTPSAVDIYHFKIDDFNIVFFAKFMNLFDCFRHNSSFFACTFIIHFLYI